MKDGERKVFNKVMNLLFIFIKLVKKRTKSPKKLNEQEIDNPN
jgi:hypothetical protein